MKNLNEYETPIVDEKSYYTTDSQFGVGGDVLDACDARDIERRLALCRDALKNIASAVVMKSRDSGKCVNDNVIDEAKQALEATKPKP